MTRLWTVFTTFEEQARGLHGRMLPSDAAYLFRNVQGGIVETRGFMVPIRVYFLNHDYELIPTIEWSGGKNYLVQDAYHVLLNPNGWLNVSFGTAHVVELSFNAPALDDEDLKILRGG